MTALDCLVMLGLCLIYDSFLKGVTLAHRGRPAHPMYFIPAMMMTVLVLCGTLVDPTLGVAYLGLMGVVAAILSVDTVLFRSAVCRFRLVFQGCLTALALALIPVTEFVEFYDAELNARPVVVRHVTVIGARSARIEAPGSVVRECESN